MIFMHAFHDYLNHQQQKLQHSQTLKQNIIFSIVHAKKYFKFPLKINKNNYLFIYKILFLFK